MAARSQFRFQEIGSLFEAEDGHVWVTNYLSRETGN